jgi:hypothetical protein
VIHREAVLLLVALLPWGLSAQQREVRGARAAPDVAIRLWVPAGFVEVIGWDMDSVDVAATPNPASRFGGGGSGEAMKFSFDLNRERDTTLAGGQLRVRVPHGARVWVKTTTAAVTVTGVRGEVDLMTVTGSVMVSDGSGVTRVESISGSATLARVDGAIRIRGGAGPVTLEAVSGTLDAATIGGEVQVNKNNIVSPPLREDPGPPLVGTVETVGGDVRFSGSLGPEGRLEIRTHDGDVSLNLAGKRAPRVTANTRDATIPAALLQGTPAAGEFVVRTFKGRINAGFMSGI